jgi:hypothetical protein
VKTTEMSLFPDEFLEIRCRVVTSSISNSSFKKYLGLKNTVWEISDFILYCIAQQREVREGDR